MSGKNADYLSHFWSLAEIEPSIRISASKDILKTLKSLNEDPSKKEDFDASIPPTPAIATAPTASGINLL